MPGMNTALPPQPPPLPKVAPVPLSYGMATTNTVPQPIQPGPMQAPGAIPTPAPPPLNFTPPTVGPAPTATPYGEFHAPDPSQMGSDPYYQFRLDQANKGAQRSAAAHGTLLSGGFQQELAKLNQGLASEEGDKIYGRARDTYTLGRDTNQQNFGQNLASYTAGTGATLDAGRLGLQGATSIYDRAYGAQRDAVGDQREDARTQTDVTNANQQAQDAFRRQMEEYRALVDNQRQPSQPVGPTLGFAPRAPIPGMPGRPIHTPYTVRH